MRLSGRIFISVDKRITTDQDALRNADLLIRISFSPLSTATLTARFRDLDSARLILQFFTGDCSIANLRLMKESISNLAISNSNLIKCRLTKFQADKARTRTMCSIIRTTLRRLRRILANEALTAKDFLMMATRLALRRTMSTACFLLFARLRAMIKRATAALTVLTEGIFDLTLQIRNTNTTLRRRINTFATERFTLKAGMADRFSLSPVAHSTFSTSNDHCTKSKLHQ